MESFFIWTVLQGGLNISREREENGKGGERVELPLPFSHEGKYLTNAPSQKGDQVPSHLTSGGVI